MISGSAVLEQCYAQRRVSPVLLIALMWTSGFTVAGAIPVTLRQPWNEQVSSLNIQESIFIQWEMVLLWLFGHFTRGGPAIPFDQETQRKRIHSCRPRTFNVYYQAWNGFVLEPWCLERQEVLERGGLIPLILNLPICDVYCITVQVRWDVINAESIGLFLLCTMSPRGSKNNVLI